MASIVVLIVLYTSTALFGYALEYVNLRHLKANGDTVPPGFEGVIDRDFLKNAMAYTVSRTRLGITESIFSDSFTVIFIVLLIGPYDRYISSLGFPFIASGLVFFMVIMAAGALFSVPWSAYSAFVIEKRFGFSKISPGLWLADLAKGIALSMVLSAALVSAGLLIVKTSPHLWWLWIWCLFLAFSVFMMYASPYIIEPLFNKFEEVEDEGLKEGIEKVLKKAGITARKVLKIDASRRTAHTNAYFTGIGHVKRIVLYDTLIEKLGRDELVSVLAHEAGHWKRKHILKSIIMIEAIGLAALYASYRLIEGGWVERLFDFQDASFYAKALLVLFLGRIASFPLGPFFAWLSRRNEREADRLAVEYSGNPEAMTGALVKLSKDNLSNLHPHPLYAAFYYSHPPSVERIRYIRGLQGRKG